MERPRRVARPTNYIEPTSDDDVDEENEEYQRKKSTNDSGNSDFEDSEVR